MQALILAAGMGRRLGEFTRDNTKCMVKVNGVTLIDRLLSQLQTLNLERVIIVTGYESDKLKSHIEKGDWKMDLLFIHNPIYDKTNNIYSLWLASREMQEDDTLLIESDLIFEDSLFSLIINSPNPNIALVAKYESWMDGTMVRIDEENNIVNFIPKKAFKYADTDFYYKTVNIYKFSRQFSQNHYVPFLEAYIKVLGNNEYYEQVLRVITLIDNSNIKALPLSGQKWYEIDDVQDLRIAETIFASGEEKLKRIQHSFGGYWRYPFLTDFCYLVNPYFPRPRMIEEMKANFETLLREYPSGMNINSLLGAKYFGIKQAYMCVGNGAAELIKSVIENHTDGNIGVVYPTFEEYPNRKQGDNIIVYEPQNPDFRYDAGDLMKFFDNRLIKNLILINPDNPSGNFIDINSLLRLIEWAASKNINIIIDESFVDFTADFEHNSLLRDSILEKYPHLTVVKSISKSYGVPGLRLGIVASSRVDFINSLKKDVAIWNINSFAEFYMQIFGKYESDYKRACYKFIDERSRFEKELQNIGFIEVLPSQANYFLCRITGRFSARELTLKLLDCFNILIKDCTGKKGFVGKGEYVRIAVRDNIDDDKLISALKTLES